MLPSTRENHKKRAANAPAQSCVVQGAVSAYIFRKKPALSISTKENATEMIIKKVKDTYLH